MKLTAILLLIGCLQVSAHGFAQGKITLRKTNASLEDVLLEINKQTGVLYSANQEALAKAKPININVKEGSLAEVLSICFAGQPLTYSLKENVIIVKEKVVAPKVTIVDERNPIDVRGKVTDEKGNPVQGVTVMIKGNGKQTLTDERGEFELSSIDREAVLVFTSVNMESFELKVNGRADVAVRLKAKVREMDKVTVTVNTGYERLPKERATGSFEFINKEEMNRRVGGNILGRLEGVSTGIFFDKRSMSGSQNSVSLDNVTIRGLSTLTTFPESVKRPLIIVNSFPYDGDINNINPNDVESITILKDAAAASIYGARAANGVIVISTKQGSLNSALQVSVNSNVIIGTEPNLHSYPRMSSSDFIEAESFLFNNGFYDDDLINNLYPAMSPVVETLEKRRLGIISAADSAAQINAFKGRDVRADFEKYVYRKSVLQTNSLTLNGGNEVVRYNMGIGYDRGLSTLIGNNDRRITFNSESMFTPSKSLSFQLGVRFTNATTEGNSLGEINSSNYNYQNGQRQLLPYERFVDESGNRVAITKDWSRRYTDTAGMGELLNWSYNPLDERDHVSNKNQAQDLVINGMVSYRIAPFLTAQGKYQYQSSNGNQTTYYNQQSYFVRNLTNLFTNLNIADPALRNPLPFGGILDDRRIFQSSHFASAQVNFEKLWKEKHQVNGFGGAEIREVVTSTASHRVYGFNDDKLSSSLVDFVNLYPQIGERGAQTIPTGPFGNTKLTDRFVSVFTNLAYTYDKKYLFSASMRRDAANLFGLDVNDKWKPFWSVGIGWNVSNESFFSKSNGLSYLKFRATYGYQGNVNTSLAPYTIITYSPASSSPYNFPYAVVTNPANPGLSWENVNQINLGLDFRSLNDRLSGSVDMYRKKSENLILVAQIDPTTGINSVKKNSAGLSGNGIDISLSSVNLNGQLRWVSELKFSRIKNKVTKTQLEQNALTAENVASGNGLNITTREGISPYAIFSYPFAGLDPATGDPQGYLGKAPSTDYIELANQRYDTANIIYHGSAIPTIFGSFNNNFSYKGLLLSISISYNLGYYFRRNTLSYFQLYQRGMQHPDFSKRWQKPGDEQITNVPSMTYPLSNGRRDDFYANSSVNVLKGDNIRLQYINLSYDLTKSLLRRSIIRSIQVYTNIENLGLIWKANDEGLDPDFDSGNTPYPPIKRFAAGLRIEL